MREFPFLLRVIIERTLIALAVLLLIFNPWFSLSQWLVPDDFTVYDLQSGWPFKLLAVIAAGFLVIMFAKTTRDSMGYLGLFGVIVILAIVAFIPFYMEWLASTRTHVLYTIYFFVMPVLLGIGLSTGYITRWLNGTLITKPVSDHDRDQGHHQNVVHDQAAQHAAVDNH